GEIMWPLVIGGYSGAALAFTAALFWDRHSRLQDEVRQNETDRRRTQERLRAEQERRVVEAKRRFGALEVELTRLKASIDRTKREQANYKHFFPDLPTGSWAAASRPLGVIVSDYELMADLATFYGHVEELRWRLRFKADASVDADAVSPIITTFVNQMADAVDLLLEQVRAQMVNPTVEQIVGAPPMQQRPTRVARTRQFTGAIRAQTPEEIAKALASQTLPGLDGSQPGGGGAITRDLAAKWLHDVDTPADEVTAQGDTVACTVFAPPSASPGNSILVQVFVHVPERAPDAEVIAKEFDTDTRRRSFQSLTSPVPYD